LVVFGRIGSFGDEIDLLGVDLAGIDPKTAAEQLYVYDVFGN